MKGKIKAYNNILEFIVETPLVKLNKLVEDIHGNFYAKLEAFNPGNSNKDRVALHI